MTNLAMRDDGFSFQITDPTSKRFFVRVVSPSRNNSEVVFSDFILDPEDNAKAIAALHIVIVRLDAPVRGLKLKFQDILPRGNLAADGEEIIRRHDQIVLVVKTFATEAGLEVTNAFLNPDAGGFDTIVLVE